MTPQHANNTRYPDFTLHRARRDSRRSGYDAGRAPRRTTRIRPGRAGRIGGGWIERDERTPRGFGLRGGRTEGPNVSTIERIGYRTYRSADGAARLPGAERIRFGRAPRCGPVAARCPACPRVARKRHARQTRDEVEDVRPCGCPARHTDRTTVQANSRSHRTRGMRARACVAKSNLGQTHELPRTSDGTTVYVLLIITCPVALQPDDPHIAAPSARTAARQQ